MTSTVEFVYYLFWIGMLIAGLHLADVRPWAERVALIGWPILIGVSVWLIGDICRCGVVGDVIGANDRVRQRVQSGTRYWTIVHARLGGLCTSFGHRSLTLIAR
jgi:hypothetical protein